MIAKIFKFSLISALFLSANWTFADSPALQISAINAGFKNDSSSQNYDFIELSKNTTDNLPLAGYKLFYYNSTGNLAGELDFSDYILVEPRLVLYFSGSPVKVEVGLCRGKKLYDKRESDAERQASRDIERHMKDRSYEG